jgi:hypothetical protein
MNDLDLLEDRLRDALARRAAATTLREPRHDPPPTELTEVTPLHRRRRAWVLQVAAALVVVAGVAGVLALVRPGDEGRDGAGTTASTAGSPRDRWLGGDDRLVEYQATTLPEGYQEISRDQARGDVADEVGVGAASVGTNCLDWHLDGTTVVCDGFLAQRNHHYGQPGTVRAITVATLINIPTDAIDVGEARSVQVQGQPAVLRPAAAGTAARVVWEPSPAVFVVLDALDPTVTDDEVLALAEGLRPVEVTPPADMAFAVATHDVPPDQVVGGFHTAYLWARPGPEPCLGGIMGSIALPCLPHADDDPLVHIGGELSTVLGGAVSAAVEQVRIETLDGGSIDAPLLTPGAPFAGDRFFLTPIDPDVVTDVVALGPGGTELARHTVVTRMP